MQGGTGLSFRRNNRGLAERDRQVVRLSPETGLARQEGWM